MPVGAIQWGINEIFHLAKKFFVESPDWGDSAITLGIIYIQTFLISLIPQDTVIIVIFYDNESNKNVRDRLFGLSELASDSTGVDGTGN
jgi:hypothetical protein